MTKLDPDQDPSVHQAVEKYFDDNLQELPEDGSRRRVIILTPDDGSFWGFVTNTLWMFFIFTLATIFTQAVYDTLSWYVHSTKVEY